MVNESAGSSETDAIVLQAPLEFALTGPVKGRDRVLARSKQLGLDIIGSLASPDRVHRDQYFQRDDWLSRMFGFGERPINVVSSKPLHDFRPEEDGRRSSFRFAWKGYVSAKGVDEIMKSLSLQSTDIYLAVRDRDISELEWSLSPIIYECMKENEIRLRKQRLMKYALVAYIGMFLFAGAVALVEKLLK